MVLQQAWRIRLVNIKDICLNENDTIHEAMRILNTYEDRIVFVAKGKKLQGTVTDGDVRRALLNNMTINDCIGDIMNRNPHVAQMGESDEAMLHTMTRLVIRHLPIVDEVGNLVKLVTLDDIITSEVHNNYVVLMCGGRGERLRPLTDTTPKPMLKVKGKPMLEHIILNLANQGLENFIITLCYLGEQIKDYFGDGSHWNINISYVEEKEPLGTAGALGLLDKDKITDSFVLMNGDVMTELNLKPLLEDYNQNKAIITIGSSFYYYQIPFGVLESDNGVLTSITEKPVMSSQINAGIYLLEPQIFDFINPNERLDMTDLLERVMDAKKTVNIFPIVENWRDVGRHEDLKFIQETHAQSGLFQHNISNA